MRAGTAGKMAAEFVERDHIRSQFPPFGYRKHYNTDLVADTRILAPNVATVYETFHSPFGQSVGGPLPFLGDPQKPLVSSKFSKWCGHILRDLCPSADKILGGHIVKQPLRSRFLIGDLEIAFQLVFAVRAKIREIDHETGKVRVILFIRLPHH